MQCPKCESEFETFTYQNVEIDRCTNCGGIWFDAQEKEDLERSQGAESIDIGDKRVGRKYNQKRNTNCPKCGIEMLRMADKTQFHIEYEFCPTCLGTFFDAGEFKDLSELTFIERLKKLVDFWLAVR
ncbi:MAG: zf-TFIIB domain-containing protein [Gammaproteobacteria bacterium]|nr:zf-TFIIB domain-containing protein [Gammaproteobacteria bacterium]